MYYQEFRMGIGDAYFFCACIECGAVIINNETFQQVYDEWHDRLVLDN